MSRPGDLKSVAVEFVAETLKKVGVDSMLGGASALCAMCLGGPITGISSVAGVVAAMALFGAIKLKKAAKDQAKDQEAATHCKHVVALLEQVKSEHANSTVHTTAALADIALQQQWFKDAIEKGPAAFNQAWKKETADCAKAIEGRLAKIERGVTDLQSAVDAIATVEFDSNWRIREIAATTARTETKVDALHNTVLAETQQIKAAIENLTSQLAASSPQLDQLRTENDGLKAQLRAVTERYLTAERARGRNWREVIEELRHDPKKLGEFLDAETDRTERDLIEQHRERAAVWFTTGEIAKAEASLRKVLALRPDDVGSLNYLGHIMRLRGELDEASKLYALVGQSASDDTMRAVSLCNLGLVEQDRGNHDAALANLKKSLKVFEKLGDQRNKATVDVNLGIIEYSRGNLNAADTHFNASLPILKRIGLDLAIASNQHNLGLVHWMRGDLEAAEVLQRESLGIHERFHAQKGIASNHTALGLIEQARGAHDAAEHHHKHALVINERLGSPGLIKNNCAALGLIEAVRGNIPEARRYWTRCLELSQKLENQAYSAMVQSWLDRFPIE